MLGCAVPSYSIAPIEFRNDASQRYGNTVDVGEVTSDVMGPAYERIKSLVKSGQRRVTLRIDSPGGEIFLGMRWIREVEDLKKAHPGTQIACIVDGAAYSMAAVILESRVCDRRLATNRSTILFHNASVNAGGGGAHDLRGLAGALEAMNTALGLLISERLGIPLEEYQARVNGRDWMMATPEALHHCVIDGIVSPMEIAPPAEVL